MPYACKYYSILIMWNCHCACYKDLQLFQVPQMIVYTCMCYTCIITVLRTFIKRARNQSVERTVFSYQRSLRRHTGKTYGGRRGIRTHWRAGVHTSTAARDANTTVLLDGASRTDHELHRHESRLELLYPPPPQFW